MGLAVLAGDLDAKRPGFPVVLAWKANCETTVLETSFTVNLTPLESLDRINHRREIEIGLEAASLQNCLSESEAEAMVETAREDLGEAWLLVRFKEAVPVDCYGFWLDPEWGTIGVVGAERSIPLTDSTAPPSNR